ncbi:potassium voltage-gated channel subfamily S member 3-like [Takifugu flavidus]|uniref:Potassium voltage-gated channel subfamily S member 3 n=1 Tax=Takifugu flavidus TaxID=433684 RepID=A0A5C6P0M0_9TELE|nr:potassium voltage-gated channel subfamily S member 3-like [Takifugu flavidus]TWW71650.1 Potassium voltage-gated channel subfamily S member 3 [Takifugu flavidus]
MVYGQVFHPRRPDDCFIVVNVGGFKQRLDQDLLKRFPQTRLGRLLCCSSKEAILELCDDFSPSEMEFYFDRNPCFFCYILNFYFTGKLHLVDGLCVVSFCQEIEYWGIREGHLDFCCSNKFHELMAFVEDRWSQESDGQLTGSSADELPADMFEGSWCGDVRRNIWIRLEKPGHSTLAKVMAVVSLAVVIGSIISMCIHSMDVNKATTDHPWLRGFDSFCVLFFSVEFFLRLSVAPSARMFLRSTLNVIDFMSVVPFYITLACDVADEDDDTGLGNVGKVVQILRLMRVFRILKLARHSAGLRSLGATLQHSAREVGQLILFVSVGVSTFSTLIYFAERDSEESELQSIPIGWWWATISMTTVGYGDTFPVTLPGKMIGTLCIVCGLLIVALPITNIFNKFSNLYQRQKDMDLRQKTNVPSAAPQHQGHESKLPPNGEM